VRASLCCAWRTRRLMPSERRLPLPRAERRSRADGPDAHVEMESANGSTGGIRGGPRSKRGSIQAVCASMVCAAGAPGARRGRDLRDTPLARTADSRRSRPAQSGTNQRRSMRRRSVIMDRGRPWMGALIGTFSGSGEFGPDSCLERKHAESYRRVLAVMHCPLT